MSRPAARSPDPTRTPPGEWGPLAWEQDAGMRFTREHVAWLAIIVAAVAMVVFAWHAV